MVNVFGGPSLADDSQALLDDLTAPCRMFARARFGGFHGAAPGQPTPVNFQ
jgi:hypothetical protein